MIISPSILNADYVNLENEINQLEKAGANAIHIDIMDGRFVQPITWGPTTVSAIEKVTSLPLEIHLMVDEPERNIEAYINAKPDSIMIHPESTVFLRKILLLIKQAGIRAGIALKLETPSDVILNCLDLLDVVLVVSCDEGFGGQPFHSLALDKISFLNKIRSDHQMNFAIEVDGGIDLKTAKQSKNAGADILVAGSYIFKNNKYEAIHALKNV